MPVRRFAVTLVLTTIACSSDDGSAADGDSSTSSGPTSGASSTASDDATVTTTVGSTVTDATTTTTTGVDESTGGSTDTGTPTCDMPTDGVHLTADMDLQPQIDAQPPGTTFILDEGTYRLQGVSPREGDVYLGARGADCERLAVMTGARLLDGFVADGDRWRLDGMTQGGQVHGDCEAGWERCSFPEDLYVDDALVHHVASVDEVASGTWFFDYDADTIWMGDDPNGHVVELTETRAAFSPTAENVTVQGLVVEKYAIPAQMGAIGDQYPMAGWQVIDNEVRFNHGTGINVATNGVVRGNFVHHNGQKGVGAGGEDVLVEDNEISDNNTAHFDAGWEAGGTKFALTTGLVVRNNCVHHNRGSGLWTDIENLDTTYEGNVVFANRDQGIFHEISYDAVIRDNIVGNNGESYVWLYGANILASTSQNVEIYGNTVEVDAAFGNAIAIIWQDRAPYVGTGSSVHDNDVVFLGDIGLAGAAADFDPATTDIFVENSLADDHYHVTDVDAAHFAWDNGDVTFAELQAYGQEQMGTIDTDIAPLVWSCDLQ